MSADETYEGWSNRETWAVALHINNDQGWQESVHDALREQHAHRMNPGEYVGAADAARAAGEIIRENVEETVERCGQGHTASEALDLALAIGSLWRVDWTELGAAFLADLAADEPVRCYSDHNEDIRTKGTCDYCGSDVEDPS